MKEKGDGRRAAQINEGVSAKAKVQEMLKDHYLGKGEGAKDFKLKFALAGTDKAGQWHMLQHRLHDDDLNRADMILKLLEADGIEVPKMTLYTTLIQFGLMTLELVFEDHYQQRANQLAEELQGITDMLHPDTRHKLRQALLASSATSKGPGTPRKHNKGSQASKRSSGPTRD